MQVPSPSLQKTEQVDFNVYIDQIKHAFDGVVSLALQLLERVSSGGSAQQLAPALLGKIEEFESVCDDIHQLIYHTYVHLKRKEDENAASRNKIEAMQRIRAQLQSCRQIREELGRFTTVHNELENTTTELEEAIKT